MTDEAGNVVAVVELDPWGGETDRSVNQRQQPYLYTSYERDGDGVDQALMRSYHGWWTRFNEPDPWEGSYDLTDPQSFNRYTYVQNDPVNFTDPSGLLRVAVVVNCRTNWVWKEHVEGGGDWYDKGEVCELMVIEVGGGEIGGGGGGTPGRPDEINFFKAPPLYEECAKHISGVPLPSAQATAAILATSCLEGVDPTLLAATWLLESSFDFAPMSNPNDYTPGNQDVGPMQINYRTWAGSSLLNGLGVNNIFGSVTGLTVGSQFFDGDPTANLRAGARILKSYEGAGRANAAGYYRTGRGGFLKGPKGRAEFNARRNLFNKIAPAFDNFFKCLRGGK
ncbi:RHS repeat-associated core domain-containing protein [Pyrinomonas methylaliphatogenes]|uniref:RHS repeat-associated core domain n=1 Tax=Pyrinomonas methylaliphatogenes TaxID=454194 RepID=A0A0B6WZ33_9BACT|nr:RHS repeat-associated core domain-containing protein [Pyrinomonas methylaliphatogenes]CDM65425.1 RHS repeat-associated core domain [Pyrinomonas methylaliphatogenes]